MRHDAGKSFQTIHDEFRPRIHRFLCRMVGEADAEDVLQEVFVKANRALPGFRGESSLTTWIYRIATNAALDHVRSSSFRQGVMTVDIGAVESQPEAQGGELMEATPLPDLVLIRDDMDACIREVVCSLPEPYLTALVLSNLNELTNAEIAGVLGISLEAVKIRIHRARARLRQELEKRCDFYRDERTGLACDRKPDARKD
jgi:RNA polymerase sigma-70 factor (ECF subfamily)